MSEPAELGRWGRRPPTPAPKGTGAGFVSYIALASVLPLATSMAMAEWSSRGVDAWLDSLGWCIAITSFLIVPPMAGWLPRWFWAICWWWLGSLLLLVGYPACVAIALAVPAGWVLPKMPDERVLSWYALGVIVLCMPGCLGLLRLVRLRYFQPWTVPDQWEAGTYQAPAWAVSAGRITRPGLMAELDRQRASRDEK